MKRLPLIAALSLALHPAFAAELSVYVFDDQAPLPDAEVRIDGTPRGRTSTDGALALSVEAGKHVITVVRGGTDVLNFEIELQADENAELIATLYPDAAPSVFVESSHQDGAAASAQATQTAAGPPGTLTGRVVNSEDGKPIAKARVFVAGTPLDIVTGEDGRFSAPITPGTYAISVIAPEYSSQTLDGVVIASGESTERAVELTPAGMELPEFVVLEPFVEGSLAAFVEEKRTSAAIADILGAEQISRAGDSDAAGALKRVTGLTLVDGKYVYIRGLGERYSSVLLNGAQIPSPDPTRRVVPLDLFPTEILNGILVQKTYSADMPGEFGGGTIQLRTRGVPEGFLLRVQGTLGYADGSTGEDALRYAGGGRDWTGFDDGAREAPDSLLDPQFPTDPAEREALGEALAAGGYSLYRKKIGPNSGFAFSIGDDLEFGDGDWSLGYIGGVRYAQNWDVRNEDRAVFGLSQGNLVPVQAYTRERTERAIDGSAFLTSGLKVGEHHEVTATLMQVRQTTDEARIDEGLLDSGNIDQRYQLRWVENELTTAQFAGEHSFPALANLVASWQYTDSAATRESPNTREYRFTYDENVGAFVSEFFNIQRFESLQDDAREARIDLKLPLEFGEQRALTLLGGVGSLDRDRVSGIRRFTFLGPRPPGPFLDLEDLLTPENIRPGLQQLTEATLATDAYTATQALDSAYLAADGTWGQWRVNLGMRREAIRQEVITRRPFSEGAPPLVGLVEQNDYLPAGTLTWAYSDKAQVRLAYSQTVSRPDLREQSPADFIEPQLDIRVQGNPDLVQAEVESLDLRWEYYFSPSESFSAALFQKDFTNPIELVGVPASGDLLQIRNALSANNFGVEFDYYRSLAPVSEWSWLPERVREWLPWGDLYLGANYAWIESEVDLGDNQGIQTNAVRPLQGQSPYVANVSLAWLPGDGKTEATLLYNVFGERITQVGVDGLPDTYEQPFHQLDFTLSTALPWEDWRIKLRLRNLLDPEAESLVGDEVARRFRRGREAALTLEWRF